MYTYINTDHAIATIDTWITNNHAHLDHEIPQTLVVTLLEIIMRNNVFVFGDLYYRQKSGTAMGTSVAPVYATIYFGIHEETKIISKYSSHLPYYKRFIDDIFLIWQHDP